MRFISAHTRSLSAFNSLCHGGCSLSSTEIACNGIARCRGAPKLHQRRCVASQRTFIETLSANRLLLVAGSNTAGRASVAAAAALALGRNNATLLVDADEPAHGMGDALGVELPTGKPSPLTIHGRMPPGISRRRYLTATKLSAPDARLQMENLMATEKWRRMLEEDTGIKLAGAFGIPVADVLAVIDCFHPPPGAEKPVALANVLQSSCAGRARHVVVDSGAAVLAHQLQTVPPAVSKGLDGFLRLQRLLRKTKDATLPAAFVRGMHVMVGPIGKAGWGAQISRTISGLESLRAAMAALAAADKAVLLVLPYRPGRAGEDAARRTIERLKPTCIALTGYGSTSADSALRPEWVPSGPKVLTLPWGEERPSGIAELAKLADAMCTG